MITLCILLVLLNPTTRRIVIALLAAVLSLVGLIFVIASGAERYR